MNVPITPAPLNLHDMITLTNQVDPLEESEDGGLSLYTTVRSFMHACTLHS